MANKKTEGFDPVTEADRAVEAELRSELDRMFPDHSILGEEFGLSGDGDYRWVIDPIDGTRAFITGQPMWGTLLGLQLEGEPIAGWMHLPVLGETYVKVGDNCELTTADGSIRTLSTSAVTSLDEAIVACTHPDMFAPGAETEGFDRLQAATRMTRFSGDCLNYGLLAMGLVDLVVENQLAIHDIVPLIPIVEGAGGVVTDLGGNRSFLGGYVVASANPELHARALAVLNGG